MASNRSTCGNMDTVHGQKQFTGAAVAKCWELSAPDSGRPDPQIS